MEEQEKQKRIAEKVALIEKRANDWKKEQERKWDLLSPEEQAEIKRKNKEAIELEEKIEKLENDGIYYCVRGLTQATEALKKQDSINILDFIFARSVGYWGEIDFSYLTKEIKYDTTQPEENGYIFYTRDISNNHWMIRVKTALDKDDLEFDGFDFDADFLTEEKYKERTNGL